MKRNTILVVIFLFFSLTISACSIFTSDVEDNTNKLKIVSGTDYVLQIDNAIIISSLKYEMPQNNECPNPDYILNEGEIILEGDKKCIDNGLIYQCSGGQLNIYGCWNGCYKYGDEYGCNPSSVDSAKIIQDKPSSQAQVVLCSNTGDLGGCLTSRQNVQISEPSIADNYICINGYPQPIENAETPGVYVRKNGKDVKFDSVEFENGGYCGIIKGNSCSVDDKIDVIQDHNCYLRYMEEIKKDDSFIIKNLIKDSTVFTYLYEDESLEKGNPIYNKRYYDPFDTRISEQFCCYELNNIYYPTDKVYSIITGVGVLPNSHAGAKAAAYEIINYKKSEKRQPTQEDIKKMIEFHNEFVKKNGKKTDNLYAIKEWPKEREDQSWYYFKDFKLVDDEGENYKFTANEKNPVRLVGIDPNSNIEYGFGNSPIFFRIEMEVDSLPEPEPTESKCAVVWSVGEWGDCVDGTHTRLVTLNEGCQDDGNMPHKEEECGKEIIQYSLYYPEVDFCLFSIGSDNICLNQGFYVGRQCKLSAHKDFDFHYTADDTSYYVNMNNKEEPSCNLDLPNEPEELLSVLSDTDISDQSCKKGLTNLGFVTYKRDNNIFIVPGDEESKTIKFAYENDNPYYAFFDASLVSCQGIEPGGIVPMSKRTCTPGIEVLTNNNRDLCLMNEDGLSAEWKTCQESGGDYSYDDIISINHNPKRDFGMPDEMPEYLCSDEGWLECLTGVENRKSKKIDDMHVWLCDEGKWTKTTISSDPVVESCTSISCDYTQGICGDPVEISCTYEPEDCDPHTISLPDSIPCPPSAPENVDLSLEKYNTYRIDLPANPDKIVYSGNDYYEYESPGYEVFQCFGDYHLSSMKYHTGTDYNIGKAVRAVADGIVIYTCDNGYETKIDSEIDPSKIACTKDGMIMTKYCNPNAGLDSGEFTYRFGNSIIIKTCLPEPNNDFCYYHMYAHLDRHEVPRFFYPISKDDHPEATFLGIHDEELLGGICYYPKEMGKRPDSQGYLFLNCNSIYEKSSGQKLLAKGIMTNDGSNRNALADNSIQEPFRLVAKHYEQLLKGEVNKVHQGDIIGDAGRTGDTKGELHMHISILWGGTHISNAINPYAFDFGEQGSLLSEDFKKALKDAEKNYNIHCADEQAPISIKCTWDDNEGVEVASGYYYDRPIAEIRKGLGLS